MPNAGGEDGRGRRRRDDENAEALTAREAETATALTGIMQALATHLGQPDVLQRMNALAVGALGCDWSGTLLWDDRRRAFRVQAIVDGKDEAWHDHLADLELTAD